MPLPSTALMVPVNTKTCSHQHSLVIKLDNRFIHANHVDCRTSVMEKRLTEKMDSLDVQTAESIVCPHLIDALEEPIITMSNQFCYCDQYWCVLELFFATGG